MKNRRQLLVVWAIGTLIATALSVAAQVNQIPAWPPNGTGPAAGCLGKIDLSAGCMIPGLGP